VTAAYVRLRFIAGVRERWEWAIHVAPGRYWRCDISGRAEEDIVDTDGTPIRRKEILLGQPLDAWPATMNGGRLEIALPPNRDDDGDGGAR